MVVGVYLYTVGDHLLWLAVAFSLPLFSSNVEFPNELHAAIGVRDHPLL